MILKLSAILLLTVGSVLFAIVEGQCNGGYCTNICPICQCCPGCLNDNTTSSVVWDYPPKNKTKKFMLIETPGTFYEAIQVCRWNGMQLASINNALENANAALKVRSYGKSAWIAGELLGNGDTWIWITTLKVLNYTNFAKGDPNNYDFKEGCVEMDLNGFWLDQDCIPIRPFLCEYYE